MAKLSAINKNNFTIEYSVFKKLLDDGSQWGVRIDYKIQNKPEGIAQAFLITSDWLGQSNAILILGDNLFFGPEVQTIDMKLPVIDAFDNMVTIPYSKILSLILAAIITICVVLFMKRSRMGQAIRATAQDARAARVLGIDTDKVYAFTFAFNNAC